MAFVYWGGKEAVAGIRQLADNLRDGKYRLNLWALKCLKSVWLPQFHQEVAHHLLRSDATVRTLNEFVEDVRKRQWIYLHVRHPDNKLIEKAGGMFCLHVMPHTATCLLTPRGLAVSFASAVNRTLISGYDAATAILSSGDITLKDLKCNLAQWRYWPTYGKKGQQWGPFPDWSLMRRSVLWHKSWSEEDQRKMRAPPSRHILSAIASLTLGPSRREAPVTGDGVTVIRTTETGTDRTI